ncbi:MAG: aminotransferase class IV [Nitrospirae bacterium]|nr:aminotransferase class IV [Nitrospirota bacterium]
MRDNPIIFFNGRWIRLKSARISPLDRGFLYGDGVFETLRAYDGKIFKLELHLQRLFCSAKRIALSFPMTAHKFGSIARSILIKNSLKNGIVRITCSRGVTPLGKDRVRSIPPTLIVTAFPVIPSADSLYRKGISLALVKTIRNHPAAIPNEIKSANFLNNILAKREATLSGADEGILLNYRGYLSEGTISNIFFVRQGKLYTPSLKSGILEGITRNCVIEIAKQSGMPVIERLIRPDELKNAEECFVTSTGYEIMPATKLNGKVIGKGKPGKTTQRLMALFRTYRSRSLES